MFGSCNMINELISTHNYHKCNKHYTVYYTYNSYAKETKLPIRWVGVIWRKWPIFIGILDRLRMLMLSWKYRLWVHKWRFDAILMLSTPELSSCLTENLSKWIWPGRYWIPLEVGGYSTELNRTLTSIQYEFRHYKRRVILECFNVFLPAKLQWPRQSGDRFQVF